MTQEEAKQRWCPFSRTLTAGKASVNRLTYGTPQQDIDYVHNDTRCLASECMVWRWDGPGKPTGYCGLAGRP